MSRILKIKYVWIFLLLINWSNISLAVEQLNIEIPLKFYPNSGVYEFTVLGAYLENQIEPINVKTIEKDKLTGFNFKDKQLAMKISGEAIPGFIYTTDYTQSSEIILTNGFEIRISNPNTLKTYLKSQKSFEISQDKNSKTIKFAPNDTFSVYIYAQEIFGHLILDKKSSPQFNNPIILQQKQAPAGSYIEYNVTQDAIALNGKTCLSTLVLSEDSKSVLAIIPLDLKTVENKQGFWGSLKIPEHSRFLKNWLYKKDVEVITLITNDSNKSYLKLDDLTITKSSFGVFLGIIAILAFLVVIKLIKATPYTDKNDVRYEKWMKLSWIERLVRFPFHFTITPVGRYSISSAQILFWTLVLVFSLIYVIFTRGEFLAITGQILILLGISATTAVVAKANATTRLRDVPIEYMKGIVPDRLPKFRDFISTSGIPNISKFQILAFTLLTGCFVIRELFRTGNFPVLDDNLLALMGISGGIYLTNEIASENVWKKIENMITEINKKEKEPVPVQVQMPQFDKSKMTFNKLEPMTPFKKPGRGTSMKAEIMDEPDEKIVVDIPGLKKSFSMVHPEVAEMKTEVNNILKNIYMD